MKEYTSVYFCSIREKISFHRGEGSSSWNIHGRLILSQSTIIENGKWQKIDTHHHASKDY